MKTKLASLAGVLIIAGLMGCHKADSSSPDTSTSGVAASTVGGALASSSATGTQARMIFRKPNFMSLLPEAVASGSCPTFKSTDANCTASAGAMWLNYSGCSFTGNVEWTGVQQLSMSSGTATCGTFPNPGASGTLYRQFVTAVSSNSPGGISLQASAVSATVDNSVPGLGNFDSQTIATIHNGGYGSAVTFAADGTRNGLTIGQHVTLSGIYDHTVTGSLTVSHDTGTQRLVDGSVKVYHNLLRVVATSTFTSVLHTDLCCWPVAGKISTVFSAGQNAPPRAAGQSLVGKTETLSFDGACGSGTLTDTDGVVSSVTFSRCF